MARLVVHCKGCGGSWHVYDRDDFTAWRARTCPTCGLEVDPQTWRRQVVPALAMVGDANRELYKDALGYGDPLFSIDVLG